MEKTFTVMFICFFLEVEVSAQVMQWNHTVTELNSLTDWMCTFVFPEDYNSNVFSYE